ncbi:MAG TPA: TetR/AcrR family transcriptional regulator [Holophagaceae bacterium]|nr:TetR/AcrR family transcriptional regulator [Holophagaceae bacterium]
MHTWGLTGERTTREGILLSLLEEFRTCGFDGVSLSRISEVTGLGKASLYHHFPGGKAEMAQGVMTLAWGWLEGNVFAPLEADGDPAARLEAVVQALEGFYAQGRKSCLLDVMPISGGPEVKAAVKAVMERLATGFTMLAADAGLSEAQAAARAEHALVALQGSLVLARGLGDPGPFLRQMQSLRERFLSA